MDVIQIIQLLLTLQSMYTTAKLNTIQSIENFHKQLFWSKHHVIYVNN